MKRSLLAVVIVFAAGVLALDAKDAGKPVPGSWLRDIKITYQGEGAQGTANVRIYFPKDYKAGSNCRTVIALHGYAYTSKDWESEATHATRLANDFNMVLVCPDMGKTVYEYSYYPETTEKWGSLPGGRFISQVLIPFLRENYGLASDRTRTGIMGVSTGGRGALLIACKNPELIGAAAGLSGDYDPSSMTRDRILTLVYGPYNDFKSRWDNDDNIMKLSENLKDTAVYLWYAAKDSVVPPDQTIMFAMHLKQLQKKTGKYSMTLGKDPHGAHQWRYWNRALPEVMAFFDKNLAK